MYLLDTNVVSELRKAAAGKADVNVVSWAQAVSAEQLYISAITLSELEMGVLSLARRDSQQGAILRHWLDNQVKVHFHGRILAFDASAAIIHAKLNVPDRVPAMDGLIAAIALANNMTVVTRNTGDFPWVATLNPWLVR